MLTEEIFPGDFLFQLPDVARKRVLEAETVCIKGVIAHYGENTESFMYESVPTNRTLNTHGDYFPIKLKSQHHGYVLTSLLNIDFNAVSKIIASMKWEEFANEDTDPPINYVEIHNQLLSISDVFRFYLPNEWDNIEYDLCTTNEGVAYTVERLKKYIAFCNRKKITYNGQFFTLLLSSGYFEIEPSVIVPVEEIKEMGQLLENVSESANELDELYDFFINGLDPDVTGINCYLLGSKDRLRDIAMISFNEIASRGKTIRQCQICGKYFIPHKRADTLYCDNPSPEAPEMTCKEYGTRRLWYERQKEDEIATLSRKIASAKGMLAKRNPDIPDYAVSYEYFKAERMKWKKDVEEGYRSKEEYREWLLLMQRNKVIKEAVSNRT